MARILVIDDDDLLRVALRHMLERDGHHVVEARDGVAAIAAFRSERADLAVVDLYMPQKSGWETLRALESDAPGLPFIIVSGGGALEAVPRGATGTLDALRQVAAFRILRKPFAWAELRTAVDALLPPEPGSASAG